MQNLCRLWTNLHTHTRRYILYTHTEHYMKHHQSCKLLQNSKLQRTRCFRKTPSPSNVFSQNSWTKKNLTFWNLGRKRFFVSKSIDHILAARHLRFFGHEKRAERPPPRQSPWYSRGPDDMITCFGAKKGWVKKCFGNLRDNIYPKGSSCTLQMPNKKHCGGEKTGRAIVPSSSSSAFLYKSNLVYFSVNVCTKTHTLLI